MAGSLTSVTGRSEIDDAWDDLLDDGDAKEASSKPAAPRVSAPKVSAPVVPKVSAPKAKAPFVAPPPKAGPTPAPRVAPPPGKRAKFSVPPLGTKRSAAPAPAEPAPAAPEASPAPAETPASPPLDSSPVGSIGALDLPPPPEFSPHTSATELPLEAMSMEDSVVAQLPVDPSARGAAPAAPDDEVDVDLDTSGSRPAIAAESASGDELDVDLDTSGSRPAIAAESASGDELDVDLDASSSMLPATAPATASPDEELDIDVSGSSSALAPVPAAEAERSSVEVANWRGTGPVQEVRRDRPVTGRSTPVSKPSSAPFAATLPQPRAPLPWNKIAVGMAALVAVLVMIMLGRGSGDDGDGRDEVTKSDSKAEEQEAVSARPETTPEPDAPEPPETTPEPDAPEATPEPDAPEATPEPDAPAPKPAPPSGGGPSPEYTAAAAEHEASGSQESLLAMVIAACNDDDGALARAALRKLKGKDLRNEAIATCKKTKVDVLAKAETYTAEEFLRKAQEALDRGDAETALSLGRSSNKVEKTGKASAVILKAACAMGDATQAQRMMNHVPKKWRPELVEHCAGQGVELSP